VVLVGTWLQGPHPPTHPHLAQRETAAFTVKHQSRTRARVCFRKGKTIDPRVLRTFLGCGKKKALRLMPPGAAVASTRDCCVPQNFRIARGLKRIQGTRIRRCFDKIYDGAPWQIWVRGCQIMCKRRFAPYTNQLVSSFIPIETLSFIFPRCQTAKEKQRGELASFCMA
jgi:hypothetical protein